MKVLIDSLLYLFSIMIIGFISTRKGIIPPALQSSLSRFVFNISLPAYVFHNLYKDFRWDILSNSIKVLAISIFCYSLAIAISIPIRFLKIRKEDLPVYQYSMIFPNVGYMGLPMAGIILGEGMIVYASIFNVAFSVLVWTYGVYLFSKEQYHSTSHKLALSPTIMAIAVYLLLFVLSIQLPSFLERAIGSLGVTATSLSMFIIGMNLNSIRKKDLSSAKSHLLLILYRLIVFPIIIYYVLTIMKINSEIIKLAFIIFMMPVGANCVIISDRYSGNSDLGSLIVVLSTLFCLITIPILSVLFL